MSRPATATLTITLQQPGQSRRDHGTSPGRVPRVVRLLAFAHQLDEKIRNGEYEDLADAARKLGLTRARVTQIANLAALAPEIQEAILATPPAAAGHDAITERTLRAVIARPGWKEQWSIWVALEAGTRAGVGTRIPQIFVGATVSAPRIHA